MKTRRKKNKKKQSRPNRKHKRFPKAQVVHQCEADVAEGLEELAVQELRSRFGHSIRVLGRSSTERGKIRFAYQGNLKHLLQLQTVLTVFLLQHYAIPRPRALLGEEHLRTLLQQINTVRALMPNDPYRVLYLGAAGSDSSVMNRLKEELANHCGLMVGQDEGDLLIRLRRPAQNAEGWEVLVRLTPRPLATRRWRVCNMQGALNGTVAHAMMRFTRPTQNDTVLNLACGSGTLMIERLACGPARRLIGCDINHEALACAYANLQASGNRVTMKLNPLEEVITPPAKLPLGKMPTAELYDWDARHLPLPEQSVDVLVADLPFGHLIGSHEQNIELYPAILQEAARVARRGGLFALITHEIRLMESLLTTSSVWRTELVKMVTLRGLHPRIFVLKRV